MGAPVERIIVASLDLASVAAGATAGQELALPAGTCDPGDIVEVLGVAALTHGLIIQGVLPVTVADRVNVRVSNVTAGAIDEPARDFYLRVIRL